MKKEFKRVLSLVLAVCTFLNIGIMALAVDYEENVQEDEVLTIDEKNTNDEEATKSENAVVTMYLCATAHSLTGHVWLYFDNIGTETVTIGYVELAPGNQMSVGSLDNTKKDGGGTYYNGERYMSKDLEESAKHTTYMEMNLTIDQLEIVSNQIKKKNIYSLIFWNCGHFATKAWYLVAEQKIVHLTLPALTILVMTLHGGKKGLVMTRPSIDECYKQTTDGIINANELSFKNSCV